MKQMDESISKIAEGSFLTEQEIEVARRTNGESTASIADSLDISEQAVRQTRYRINKKVRQMERTLNVLDNLGYQASLKIRYTPDRTPTDSDFAGMNWTDWTVLSEHDTDNVGGIIRVRHFSSGVVYIGATNNLHQRLSALNREVHRENKPDIAPVSAAPTLWSLLEEEGGALEVSITEMPDYPKRWLKAIQAGLIAHIRQSTGSSPLAAFGGGEDVTNPVWNELGDVDEEDWPQRTNWLGVEWSDWSKLSTRLEDPRPKDDAVYMIRSPDGVLNYIGSTTAPTNRLRKHEKSYGPEYEYCYFEPEVDFDTNALWEIEGDVIGAYILASRSAPTDFQSL